MLLHFRNRLHSRASPGKSLGSAENSVDTDVVHTGMVDLQVPAIVGYMAPIFPVSPPLLPKWQVGLLCINAIFAWQMHGGDALQWICSTLILSFSDSLDRCQLGCGSVLMHTHTLASVCGWCLATSHA